MEGRKTSGIEVAADRILETGGTRGPVVVCNISGLVTDDIYRLQLVSLIPTIRLVSYHGIAEDLTATSISDNECLKIE